MCEHQSAFDILRNQLAAYTADDYLTDAPYQMLAEFTGRNVVRYIQFLGVLLMDASEKGIDGLKDLVYCLRISASVKSRYACSVTFTLLCPSIRLSV